ncbi:Rieske (2Fe-2S) protein [Nocardioides solisilvae]|uniref:Rieske (2Fe-2S) protein n=1 Tax=Nocardioides solisilvae TaxID=1542435 RepID=UPI001EF47895|nr:Rieske (2Fe-2S) protein [Nocardioides solisilvae]
MSTDGSTGLSRRHALSGAVAVGVGAPLLAACGGDDAPVDTAPEAQAGDVLTTTSEVPVGGCAVFPDEKVVVTQPTEGEFRCFSSVCTHQGCAVSSSSDGVIPCTCHGSRFSLEDGSVLEGPATAPLQKVEIEVSGDSITAV